MRRTIQALFLLGATLLLAGSAHAAATLQVIWVSTTGNGTPGSNTIEAKNGDQLVAEFRLTAGSEGISVYSISLEFDQALDDELDLVSASGFVPPGFDSPIGANPASTSESTGSAVGTAYSFGALCSPTPCGPVSTTFVVGTVTLNVKAAAVDGSDVFTGSFNSGSDGIIDGTGTLPVFEATFLNATVDGGSVSVPFGPRQTVATGSAWPYDIQSADVDRDGDLDLLVAFSNGNRLAWFENTDGAGSFALGQNLSTTLDTPLGIAASDLDGDGDLDVVASVSGDDDLVVWFENTDGVGTYGGPQIITTVQDGPRSPGVGDLDRDGDIDLAVCSHVDEEISWYENDGTGTFTRHLEYLGFQADCRSITLSDADGDGDLDLLNARGAELLWWENQLDEPSNDFAYPVLLYDTTYAPIYLEAADIDGDGDPDPISAAQGNMLAWYPNSGGTFGVQVPIETETATGKFSAVDLDMDGDLDVVSVYQFDDRIEWHENTAGDGSAWTTHFISEGPEQPFDSHAADLDGDGDLDVVTGSITDQIVSWFENSTVHRNATFVRKHEIHTNAGNRATTWADLDRDGDPDVLTSDVTSLRWHQNTAGDGSAWTVLEIATGSSDWREAAAADMDGDGDVDVLASLGGDATIAWYENDGTPGGAGDWSVHVISTQHELPVAVAAADIDRDGDLDVVAASANDDKLRWHENLGGDGLTWTATEIATAGLVFAISLETADMDRDGDLDVVAAGTTLNTVSWYENDGTPSGSGWTEHAVGSVGSGGEVDVVDMDRDGDLDVVMVGGGDLIWSENTAGDGSSFSAHVVASEEAINRVIAADLDSDGDLDLLATASNWTDAGWWENTAGDGSAWTQHAELTPSRDDVAVVDIDGDGDLDLISTENGTGNLVWDENGGGQFSLPTTDSAPPWIEQGVSDDVLTIVARHNGRVGDADVELTSFELLFELTADVPLSSAQANAIIDSVEIHLDDGSDVFEEGTDTLVTSVDLLDLTVGVQSVTFTAEDPAATVAQGTPRTYFVVTRLTEDAASQPTPTFRVSHRTESSSTASAATGEPLSLEIQTDVGSGVVTLVGGTGDTDNDGLSDDDELNVYGTNPADADSDSDGVCDGPQTPGGCLVGPDNCPLISNGSQTNSDAAPAGDDCQCGDVVGDAGIDASDLLALREYVVGRTPSVGPPDLDHCDVNADADCDVADVVLLTRLLQGASASIENGCPGYSTP